MDLRRRAALALLAALAGIPALGRSPLGAQDILRLGAVEVTTQDATFEVPVRLSLGVPADAYILSVDFDSAVVGLTGLTVAGTEAAAAEFTDAEIDSGPEPGGFAVLIAILEFDPPFDGKVIPAGPDRLIGQLDMTLSPAALPGATVVRLQDQVGGGAARNAYVTGVDDVFPVLEDGTATITAAAPRIDAVEPGFAAPGETMTLRGADFFATTTLTAGGFPWPLTVLDRRTATFVAGCSTSGPVAIEACNGTRCGTASYRCVVAGDFSRGDINANGRLTVADAVGIFLAVFARAALVCPDAADVDDNGRLELVDAMLLLQFVFATGSPPRPPYPGSGPDPTADGLGCDPVAP